MIIRDAAIYICVFFLPLTFVAMIWPATGRWARRLVELLVAIVLAKFVIVSILTLASAAIANTGVAQGDGNTFERMLAGSALLVLAAWSPFALLRMIPMMEVAAASVAEPALDDVRGRRIRRHPQPRRATCGRRWTAARGPPSPRRHTRLTGGHDATRHAATTRAARRRRRPADATGCGPPSGWPSTFGGRNVDPARASPSTPPSRQRRPRRRGRAAVDGRRSLSTGRAATADAATAAAAASARPAAAATGAAARPAPATRRR